MAKTKGTGPARKTRIRPVTQDRNPKRQYNKRAEENKAIRREALREQLQAKEYLRQIQLIDDELKTLNQELKDLGFDGRKTSKAAIAKQLNENDLAINKADTRVKVLKTRLDLNFKRLNKVLPDLKAVELSDPNGNAPFSSFVDAVRELTQSATLGLDGSEALPGELKGDDTE